MDFIENEKPGILVLVKCLDVIGEFLDKKSLDTLKSSCVLHCRRFYFSRQLPKIIAEKKRINKELLATNITIEDTSYISVKFRTTLVKLLDSYDQELQKLLIAIFVLNHEMIIINPFNAKNILKHHVKNFFKCSANEQKEYLIKTISHGELLSNAKLDLLKLPKGFKNLIQNRKKENYINNFNTYLSKAENGYIK
jgi:hypothetical protein